MTLIHDILYEPRSFSLNNDQETIFHFIFLHEVYMDHYLFEVYTKSKVKGHWNCMITYFVFIEPKLSMCSFQSVQPTRLVLYQCKTQKHLLTVSVDCQQLHLIRCSTAAPYQTRSVSLSVFECLGVLQQLIHTHSKNPAAVVYCQFEKGNNKSILTRKLLCVIIS